MILWDVVVFVSEEGECFILDVGFVESFCDYGIGDRIVFVYLCYGSVFIV